MLVARVSCFIIMRRDDDDAFWGDDDDAFWGDDVLQYSVGDTCSGAVELRGGIVNEKEIRSHRRCTRQHQPLSLSTGEKPELAIGDP